MSPGAWLLPIGAGLGYSLGVVAIQRSLAAGVSGGAVNLVCNVTMGLIFQILWLLPSGHFTLGEAGIPVLCGVLFFLGQIMIFRAIAAGDVSVSTPLLGTKVLFVALFGVALSGQSLPVAWWWACLMATAGIVLVSGMKPGSGRGVGESVLWSLAAAATFALTDVLVQCGALRVGYPRFAPVMFGTMGALSLCHLPGVLALRDPLRIPAVSPSVPFPGVWLSSGASCCPCRRSQCTPRSVAMAALP